MEPSIDLRDRAVKRFIDFLFLNGNGDVSLKQEQPLNFSEIRVDLISA